MEIKKILEWQDQEEFNRELWWQDFVKNLEGELGMLPEEHEIPSDEILIKLYPHVEDSRLRKVEFRKEWKQRAENQEVKNKANIEDKGKNIDDLEIKQYMTTIGDMIKNEQKNSNRKFRDELDALIASFPELKNVIVAGADVVGAEGIESVETVEENSDILKFSEYKNS